MAAILQFNYTGGSANDNPNSSLGGVGSSEKLITLAITNLFDSVPPERYAAGDDVTYRAIDIKNIGDAQAIHVEFFLVDTTNSETTLAMWYDSTGTQSIVNEQTEPTGATWTQPLEGSRQAVANIAAAGTSRIWIRRTIDQNASALEEDTATLKTWFN
jgi:hypothetical protein